MLGINSSSLANPIGGSSAFDHGTREIASLVTYSVGDKSVGDEYITKPKDGSDVTITIKDRIAKFSFPQTHRYIGVGDKVTFHHVLSGYHSVYLNKKISTSEWEVHNNLDSVSDWQDLVVTKIDKTFSLIDEAIAGPDSGAKTLLGTSDLVFNNIRLRISAYKSGLNEICTSAISIIGWASNIDHYVRIFTPSNIKTECNSSQRHEGVKNDDKYKIICDTSLGLFIITSSYTEIEGLQIDGNSRTNNSLIDYASTDLNKTKIFNNILSNAQYGISSSQVPIDNQVVEGNIIYGMTDGINMNSRRLTAYNNTITKFSNIGINLTAALGTEYIRNCLIQKGLTGVDCVYIEPDATTTTTTTLPPP
jgi:plastocyanin